MPPGRGAGGANNINLAQLQAAIVGAIQQGFANVGQPPPGGQPPAPPSPPGGGSPVNTGSMSMPTGGLDLSSVLSAFTAPIASAASNVISNTVQGVFQDTIGPGGLSQLPANLEVNLRKLAETEQASGQTENTAAARASADAIRDERVKQDQIRAKAGAFEQTREMAREMAAAGFTTNESAMKETMRAYQALEERKAAGGRLAENYLLGE